MRNQERINTSKIIITDGSIVYVCSSSVGNADASKAVWSIKKVDQTDPDNILITWASSSDLFNKIATDPAVYF
jgi:hypothetical protein